MKVVHLRLLCEDHTTEAGLVAQIKARVDHVAQVDVINQFGDTVTFDPEYAKRAEVLHADKEA